MPILPAHKSLLSILNGFRDKMTSRTNITAFTRDSKARAIADALSEDALAIREEQVSITLADQISSASGQALDQIGDKLGLPRQRARHAITDFSEHCIAFYVETGTFGDINSATDIALTSAVKVMSDVNNNELGTSVEYQLVQAYTLVASESLQYVTARAVNLGTASNVGANVLRRHTFTNYTDVINGTLKVINFYPILNGVDEEIDDLYRFRLANHYNRLLQNNDIRMKLTALDVPGIVNTRVEPGYFGIGTAGVFALGPENQSNTRLTSSLQERLDSWRLPGGEYIAVPATEVHFDFEIEMKPTRPLTANQIVRLKADVNKAFLAYFRTLNIGGVVDLGQLSRAVQKRVNTVAAFTQRGGDKTFKKVWVRKSFSGGATDEKARVISGVYVLNRDEFASLGTLDIEIV